jgi:hypothetical protein
MDNMTPQQRYAHNHPERRREQQRMCDKKRRFRIKSDTAPKRVMVTWPDVDGADWYSMGEYKRFAGEFAGASVWIDNVLVLI